jgi:hypothetical protein
VSGIEDLLDVETNVRDEQDIAMLDLPVNLDFKIWRLARTLQYPLSVLCTEPSDVWGFSDHAANRSWR